MYVYILYNTISICFAILTENHQILLITVQISRIRSIFRSFIKLTVDVRFVI